MELGFHPCWHLGAARHQLITELDHRCGCALPAMASQAAGSARSGREDPSDTTHLIAPLASARSARIALSCSPTSSSLPDDKACPLAPPQHGESAIRSTWAGLSPVTVRRQRPELTKPPSTRGYIEPRSERSGRSYPQPIGSGATSNGVVVLRTRHFQRSAAILAGLLTLVGITVVDIAAAPVLAVAEPTDGTLTVIVNRDVDGNGNYSGDIDQPQPGVEIAVTDASEHRVTGITDRDGRFVLRATNKLKGGRYFVVAKIPPALSELTPVPESSTFQPLSTTVDVTSDNQTVRFGVALGRPLSQPTPPEATGASRGSDRPGLAQFAVGDLVWRDDNRSGVQDPGESPAAQVSV